MHDHAPYADRTPDPEDVGERLEALQGALHANGITLPSLGLDLPSLVGHYRLPLIALGNCNVETAGRLTEVLLKAAGR
ncbi:hypothetical protein [Streptomyces pinistramenti]|uniref:hypothetical protein n=1 Tax=Streptomyces pinistramenti TaxID=2884812 RepID=UPI001D063559|nr:hypothetical protein [Streptomyces pinistramenti]MCB5911546.1 hypothetical protein [Streptomyces pinistramenti]